MHGIMVVRNFEGTSRRIVIRIKATELRIKDFRIGFFVGIFSRSEPGRS